MIRALIVLAAAALFSTGCAYVSTDQQALPGMFYSDMTSPGEVTGVAVGSKYGTSSAESYAGFVALGDASINSAAIAGGLNTVSHIDYHAWSVGGFYARLETYVYGQ